MQVTNVEHKLANTLEDIDMIRESIANLNALASEITDRRAQLNAEAQLRAWHKKVMQLEGSVFILRQLSKNSNRG